METASPLRRRTRIVCVSDTHNHTPSLPKGDVLIHAGDLTNQGSYSELKRQMEWIERADFEVKIVIAGNHDITLDSEFYAKNGSKFHNQAMQKPKEALSLVTESSSITYLCHDSAKVVLKSPNGPRTYFTVFGSPYSPAEGTWAFGYAPGQASSLWADLSAGIDILVVHGPPKGICDLTKAGEEGGCSVLRETLGRTRPSLVVCGHRHEGRGCKILESLPTGEITCKTLTWKDPGEGTGKLSLVDLTGRKGKECWTEEYGPISKTQLSKVGPSEAPAQNSTANSKICVVNAAIMAHSYGGLKRFNKPIVVDIDLPTSETQPF